MKKNRKIIRYLLRTIIVFAIMATMFASTQNLNSIRLSRKENILAANTKTTNYIYLSDLPYLTTNNWSYNGWGGHAIQMDKNQEGRQMNLIVNGETRPYAKGIGLHAKGQIVYDISTLSTNYPRFVAKLGVDASRAGTNASVWFQIFVSNDGEQWISLLKTDTMTATSEALAVDLDVTGYQYLKIYVDPIGDNSSDHGNIADARLVSRNYVMDDVAYDTLHKVNYYDEILGQQELDVNYQDNYKLVLERELVRKLGYWSIQNSVEVDSKIATTLDWILSNTRVLEEVIEVGEISNGMVFLQALSNLYHRYEADLRTTNGYVYEKMMVGLAAAYSTDRIISPLAFSFQAPTYDYMERFAIMKRYFDTNQFRRVETNALAGHFVPNEWFKDYHVELMRMVMQDGTSNGDLVWLNGFTNEKQSVSFYMIGYVSPVYTQDKYYSEENRETYDERFYLSKYGVPYGLVNGVKIPRYWMIFANGGICWNASRAGQSMYRVNGIPATGAYQVGHELYIQYYEDGNGNGYWTTRYGNWSGAGSTWGGANPYRYIFNWNNKYFTSRHISGSRIASSTGYLYLGQDNLNHYEEYKKSLYYNFIANSYTSHAQKLDTYFKAVEVNPINLDSYDGIITVYKEMSANNEINSHDWYELALKIVDAYKYHPVPMFDLLKVIRPYLEGSEKLYVDQLEKETLEKATTITASKTLQVDAVRTHARQLLNQVQPDPMTFSFDGENAGKIMKNQMYDLAWAYSLDGGNTFTEYVYADSVTLTADEIASITSQNDIVFKFMGLTDYRFTIDIKEGSLSNLLFANDLENRVIGIDLTYEWRNHESDAWTSYRVASPDNTGNKTLYVRRGATGTQLATGSLTYTFTADNQPNTRKYVPVSHLSIEAVSTEATGQGGAAAYAIDGNYHTRYHSNWYGSDTERYIIIKLDKPRYVSAVEFVPAGGGNGKIYDGTILGSTDGENWKVLAQRTGLDSIYGRKDVSDAEAAAYTQSFDIPEEKRQEVQYIKIVADRTNGNWFAARGFNIFQDLTVDERPTAGIGYSTTEPTTENVVARLVNVSAKNYEITSEGGDTHTFTEEGEHSFTFTFVDKDTGVRGYATAVVDWIDRTAPTATIEYSTTNPTNGNVIATLKPSEEIKVVNNGYYLVDEDGKVYDKNGELLEDYTVDENGIVKDSTGKVIDPLKYEFFDNGKFTFEFEDRAGNRGTATATVNSIDRVAPIATITYDINSLTNKNVTATITFNEEQVKVTNNNHNTKYVFTKNGEFKFEFQDAAGNKGSITAAVNWIDKKSPTAELKYEKYADRVVVRVVNPSKQITFQEGNGVYTYTKNGEYEIVFYDSLGNVGKLSVRIDSLKNDDIPSDSVKRPVDSGGNNKNNQNSSSTTSNSNNSGNLKENNSTTNNKINDKTNNSQTEKENNPTNAEVKKETETNTFVWGVAIVILVSSLALFVSVIKKRKNKQDIEII